MIDYRLTSIEEIVNHGLVDEDGIPYSENEDNVFYSYVVRLENDKPVEVIGRDCSSDAPEDATLVRSYAWVIDALNKAYDYGRAGS